MSKICFCIPINCDTCAELSVGYCPSNPINIPCNNLTNGTTYYLWVMDKLNNIFSDTVVGNSDGSFDINKNNFPDIFTPDFGSLDIYLSTDNQGQNIQSLTIISTPYNCIILSVDEPVFLTDNDCSLLTDEINEPLIT